MSQPIWVKDDKDEDNEKKAKLLLARRVEVNGKQTVQGVWLNWDRIKEIALSAVPDHLGQLDLIPVYDVANADARHMLATIPAQIVVPEVDVQIAKLTPIRISLLVAWGCVVLGVSSITGLLWGVIRLSERRGAFVSAVTHELRTPPNDVSDVRRDAGGRYGARRKTAKIIS